VVESGNFSYLVDGKDVGGAGENDCFGELALLYNVPRQASVVALSG